MSNFQSPLKISAPDVYVDALIFENAVIGIHSEIVRISLLCNELLMNKLQFRRFSHKPTDKDGKNFLHCLEEI